MKQKSEMMLQGPLLKNIILYSIPIVLTGVLQLLFNAADLVVVGRYCGSISLGAVGATGAVTSLLVNLFIGLSLGTGVSVAHALGARESENIHRCVHTAIPAALICGGIVTLVGLVCSGPMLRLMGTPEDVLPLSESYLRIYFCGVTFTILYNFCAAILRAAGDTKGPLIFLSIAGVINVLLNLFFVTQLEMNVAGVALATAISQAVSALLALLALTRRTDDCKLHLSRLRIYKPQLLKLIRIGLPAGINSSLFAISNATIQSSINSFGQVVMSGNAAASNIESFVAVMGSGVYQSTINFVGQNVGARQYDRAKRALKICLICGAISTATVSLLAYTFGRPLLSIYITDSAEAVEWGMVRLSVVCTTWFLATMMDVTTGSLRGMGASAVPMVISILGVCVLRIGWICTGFQLPAFHSPAYLYAAYPVSWLITFAAQLVAFTHVYRKHTGALPKNKETVKGDV